MRHRSSRIALNSGTRKQAKNLFHGVYFYNVLGPFPTHVVKVYTLDIALLCSKATSIGIHYDLITL